MRNGRVHAGAKCKSMALLPVVNTMFKLWFKLNPLHAGDKSKSMALLPVVNTMFKLYFKLNTLRNCKPCIQAVEAMPEKVFDLFPKSERVTYKYYAGRLAIFQDQLVSPFGK